MLSQVSRSLAGQDLPEVLPASWAWHGSCMVVILLPAIPHTMAWCAVIVLSTLWCKHETLAQATKDRQRAQNNLWNRPRLGNRTDVPVRQAPRPSCRLTFSEGGIKNVKFKSQKNFDTLPFVVWIFLIRLSFLTAAKKAFYHLPKTQIEIRETCWRF